MPDPFLYLKAMGSAAIVSALFLLIMIRLERPARALRQNSIRVLGIGLGLFTGYGMLSLRLAWPPVNGLDRFLMIIIPTTLGIELIAGFPCVPIWFAWLMRICLATTIPRILLHGSVYLHTSDSEQDLWKLAAELAAYSALLVITWWLLCLLSKHTSGASIPLALSLTTLCSGLTIMMAGYIKGGEATFPLTAATIGTTLGAGLTMKRTNLSAMIGIGVVGLFGIVFVGRFFGRLSMPCEFVLLVTPLLCWGSEIPYLRNLKPWLIGSLRLFLVAIPLIAVLALAKHDFDRKMAPLLGQL